MSESTGGGENVSTIGSDVNALSARNRLRRTSSEFRQSWAPLIADELGVDACLSNVSASLAVWWNRTSPYETLDPIQDSQCSGRMDQRRRTVTVVAYLAAAMGCTATLLAWMDPSPPPSPQPLTAEQMLRLARSVVTDAVVIEPNRWQRVEVFAGSSASSVGSAGPMLTARADTLESHFFVSAAGRPSRASRWCTQKSALRSHAAVRIQVARPSGQQPMTSAQWFCVRAILLALDEAIATTTNPLPVHVQPDLTPTRNFTASTDKSSSALATIPG